MDVQFLARRDYFPGELVVTQSSASASALAQYLSFQRCA